ncbi:hypothetical protein C4568_04115 [Candidatus Parcubacteria bacterium]|nr:MAG: hypothetical protein C4568_04115 [Candidatus Parcubacteria bacterium]
MDAAHEKNLNSLHDQFEGKHEAEHIADTYEKTVKMFPEFSHDELLEQAEKRLKTELIKTVD